MYDVFKAGSGNVAIKESMNFLGRPGVYSFLPTLPLRVDQRELLYCILEGVGFLTPPVGIPVTTHS